MQMHKVRRMRWRYLLGLAALLVVFVFMGFVALHRSRERADLSAHSFPVSVFNARDGDSVEYIWVSPDAMVQAWLPCSDAADDPIAVSHAKLLLADEARLGNGYSVERMKEVRGSITLPSTFNLKKYIRKGYDLSLIASVEPNGFHSKEFPFEFASRTGMGNAYGKVVLNRDFPARPIRLTYKPDGHYGLVESKLEDCPKELRRLLSILQVF